MHNGSQSHKKRSVKSGLPPGTLVHIGHESDRPVQISAIGYAPGVIEERQFRQIDQYLQHPFNNSAVLWVNVEGVHDVELIRAMGEKHTFHPLVLEDIVNTVQRPKIEDYGDYLFIVLKMLRPVEGGDFSSEQVSIILGPDYLFTFQEGISGDAFDPVRDRIRSKGKICGMGADYLAYALIDAIVDGYFSILEELGERIVDVEEELTLTADQGSLQRINGMKKNIIFLRKAVWPLREAISFLERGDSPLLHDATKIYFRDVYDHTVQVIDTVETYRDLLSGMLDLYLSSISNRTNEVMKFLTIVGTIFLPLTFLVGVYGMNFKNFPELEWKNGYFALWGVMIALALLMVAYFRKKRWL
ncbi:MAG: magnesium/cobalt transporter CorA [Desulfuromonadaceae bacterium]|nr:magnesium/cobalt transporter CorA [Desulfuromonadaceae bacterium]